MGMKSAWRELWGNSANTITTSEELESVLRSMLGGGVAKSGVSVSAESAMRQATVYGCVRVLADSIAHLPLGVFRRNGDHREPARDMRVYSLLHDQPNEWQTSFEWREQIVTDLELTGNHYSLIVRNFRGEPDELIRLPPGSVTPKQDKTTLEVTYDYVRPDRVRLSLERSEVFHVRGMGDDGIEGKDPIQYFRETVGDAVAQQEHGSRFFSNGAKPGVILESDPGITMDQPSREALRDDFAAMYSGGENTFKTAVLPGGLSVKPISMSNENSQFIESRKFSRSEICGMFRVPPHKVGDLERATFSNIEHQSLAFVTDSLTPRLVRIEQAINRDLISEPGAFSRFNVSALLRGDFKSRQEGLQVQRRNGIINANMWRAIEDMNPRKDPGGEEYIIESNMTTGEPSE